MIFIKHSTYSASSPGFLVTIGEHTSSHFCCSGLGHCNLVGINICCGRGVGMAKLIGGGDNINTICNHCGSGGTTLYTISKETGLHFCTLSRECCSLPSTTFSKRMSHTIRNYTTGVTALRQNTGQFLWRRPSSFCSVRAISLPPALLDRLCYHIFSATVRWSAFVRPFGDGAQITMFQTFSSHFWDLITTRSTPTFFFQRSVLLEFVSWLPDR